MARDTIRESWFEQNGWNASWSPEVSIRDIEIERSARDQIRLGAEIDKGWVQRLAAAYKAGATFPAVILTRTGHGKYHVADGIHRLAACSECDIKVHDAYVVDNATDERQLELLRRSANVIGAKWLDDLQAVLQAVALCDAGWNASEAAAVMRVAPSTVSKRLRARDTAALVAKTIGISGTAVAKLSQESLDALGTIRRDDLFRAAANIALRGAIPGDIVRQIANEARSVSSDVQAKKMVTEWTRTYASELAKSIGAAASNAAKSIREMPKARLDRAVVRMKGVVTFWRNHVDIKKLDAQSKKHAATTLRWAAQELAGLEKVATNGVSSPTGRPHEAAHNRSDQI